MSQPNQDVDRVHALAGLYESRKLDMERAEAETSPVRDLYYESHKTLFLAAAMAILVDENNAPEILTLLAYDLGMGYSPEMAAQTMGDTIRLEILDRIRRTTPGREQN